MGNRVTIGGDRLGSGNRMKANMHGYERSTHDLSHILRSTMSAGTLVPFMAELALPGDTFDINLNCDVLTHPTIGPLFGSYKIQLDVFQVPIRLYQAKLHMNMLNIGMKMSTVPLPQVEMTADKPDPTKAIDNQQINPSAIWSYLGIRGVAGSGKLVGGEEMDQYSRNFNAVTYLAYWDIYKCYYANKQEEIGAVIHRPAAVTPIVPTAATLEDGGVDGDDITIDPVIPFTSVEIVLSPTVTVVIAATGLTAGANPNQIEFLIEIAPDEYEWFNGTDVFADWSINVGLTEWTGANGDGNLWKIAGVRIITNAIGDDTPIQITTFDLVNIDTMRLNLLKHDADTPYLITQATIAPYGLSLQSQDEGGGIATYSKQFSQEGLGLKTYNSDLFNNWIQTEWIDGPDGIAEVTAIDTSGGSFTIDELNLSKKVYDMLNRIAISDGTYDAWLDSVYDHKRTRNAENPMYIGGLIQNLVFQEVVSNAASQDQPLGTLAGRGKIGQKKKGGHIIAKVDEPSYIIGIASLTPIIDYSQGNKWDMSLKTMDDLHKPALDEIGYQDLITDQMAWFDTKIVETEIVEYNSAGKQPAWINYMTNVNKVLGNFADQNQQMFMVLNRRYNPKYEGSPAIPSIEDLTTYIDPSKFNHIFADTRLDAQNFWIQIGMNIEARRKMSAKVIPNL